MAIVRGDANATLKDLDRIMEDTVAQVRPSLVPLICDSGTEEGAYTKITVPANVPMPSKLEGERKVFGKQVNVTQSFDQVTYELTVGLDSDLVRNAKAYDFASLVRESGMSAVLYPDYLLSQAIIGGNAANGYDGNYFYGNTHTFAKAGSANIDNLLAKSGSGIPELFTDLHAAINAIRGFKDNAGRLLNQTASFGKNQLVVHCPLALGFLFRGVLNSTMIPQAITNVAGTQNVGGAPLQNNPLLGAADLFEDGYLDADSSSAWYLHYVGMPQKPFIYRENYPIKVETLGFGSEEDIKNNRILICIRHRFVLGYYRFDRSVKTA